jgi:hypothetical protein
MKTIFDNGACIILWCDETKNSDVTDVTKHIGWDKLTRAYEVWMYKSSRDLFFSYKNRGGINEIIQRMSDMGVELKVSAVTIDNAMVKELRFATEKDRFHFKLKF